MSPERREYNRIRNQRPERKEYQRLNEQKRRRRAKELGQCGTAASPRSSAKRAAQRALSTTGGPAGAATPGEKLRTEEWNQRRMVHAVTDVTVSRIHEVESAHRV